MGVVGTKLHQQRRPALVLHRQPHPVRRLPRRPAGADHPRLRQAGISIPSFGIVLHALQQSSDVNVLSTPHLLTSDNEEAEITVGQNVPFQAGFAPAASHRDRHHARPAGSLASAGSLLGGWARYYAPINRQNVELKLNIKPQINASDYIRMVINESTEEIASTDPVLGPTTSKRTAKTTVVARIRRRW